MLHLDSPALKKTGVTYYNGAIEVTATYGDQTHTFSMTKEELKLRELLLKIKDIKLRDELEDAIEDYETAAYSRGYDEAEIDESFFNN